MPRRTKIVATLGPATDVPGAMEELVAAGVDVVRLNFAHGTHAEHRQRAELARECARARGREIGVLADLQGPKIRIQGFSEGGVVLREGDRFILDADCDPDEGDEERVGITYKALPEDLNPGDILAIDDGWIMLQVESIQGNEVICRVMMGGSLTNSKGINRQGGGLSAPVITDKDREDIRAAVAIEADYVAVSFLRSADDVHEAARLVREAGGTGGICAKIERAEAIDALEEIIDVADVVMIARGDLGVEIGDAELPAVQKHIISLTQSMNRVVITATQMMQSMVTSHIPTRAEVFDVANAVLDGTDAVMLSAETATGRFPARAVEAMDRICRGAERQPSTQVSDHRLNSRFGRIDEAIAMAAMYTANHLGVKAIVALTESGSTPLWMSRISSAIPIYALTAHTATQRRVMLYRGVTPVQFDIPSQNHVEVNQKAIDLLLERGAVQQGDLVVITKGDLIGVHGGTNAMKIVRIGDHLIGPGI